MRRCRVTGQYAEGAEYVAGLFPAALQGRFAQVKSVTKTNGTPLLLQFESLLH